MDLFSTTLPPHRCSLEVRASEPQVDRAKSSGSYCEERGFSPSTKANPIMKPNPTVVSRYGRSSSSSLWGRDTLLPLSIFGWVPLLGDSSGVGGSMEEEVGEAHIPLCIVDADGKGWNLNSKGVMPESEKEFGSEHRTTVSEKGNED